MELRLPIEAAKGYSSGSQRARVMTERWVQRWGFCPNCGNLLRHFEQNRPVADFYCNTCSEEYELKATGGTFGGRVVDGAYSTMIGRLNANNNPNFLLLKYEPASLAVRTFLVIPKFFFVPDIIERRKPLGGAARRAGWIGCNILMRGIPDLGKIFFVEEGIPRSKREVLGRWRDIGFVGKTRGLDAKGWLLDVLICVESLRRKEFSLEDVYGFESELKKKHPDNNNIRAKVRQQLQLLRDRKILEFTGRGTYRMKAGGA